MSKNQLVQNLAINANTYPTLWVEDILTAQNLSGTFRIIGFNAISGEIPAGENYILAEPGTPEVNIRGIAWKIQTAGRECQIFWTKEYFLDQLARDKYTGTLLTAEIFDRARPYREWAAINDQNKLTLPEAAEIAKVAIAYLPEPQKLVELAQLQKRSGVSSWDWGQMVKSLEKEFALELRSRQGNDSIINSSAGELSLRSQIIDILHRCLSPSQEKQAFLELSGNTQTQPKEIEALAHLIRREQEIEEGRRDRHQEIEELLSSKPKNLDLAQFLPPSLAGAITSWCKWLNIRPEVALTAILSTVSSLHAVGTELVIHRAQEFSVPPTLFTALVAESGQKKSPILKTLIRKPLGKLQREAKASYEKQLIQYQLEYASWEKEPTESKPIKPVQPVYFFTDSTGEGIKAQAQECPDKALYALVDEISGMFNSANQYRGGRGADRQDMLSYYDGFGQTVLRATGIKVDTERIYLSIFGGIQPKILRKHTKDLDDPDGHWARFLFVQQHLAASILHDDGDAPNISELLTGFYRGVAELGLREYTLSREAFKRYQKVYNDLEQKRVNHPQAGMRAIFSKMEGIIGRLALNLHALSLTTSGNINDSNSNEISLDTMNKAIELASFYLGEIQAIHTESAAESGKLPAVLAKLLDTATIAGRLTTREAIRKHSSVIKTAGQAVELFRELEACGYGTVLKIKQSWVFTPNNQETEPTSVIGVITSVIPPNDSGLPIDSNSYSKSVIDVMGVIDFPSQPNTEKVLETFDASTNDSTLAERKAESAEINDTNDSNDSEAETKSQSGISTVIESVIPPMTVNDTNTLTSVELPPVGAWVRIDSQVARVIKHHPEAKDRVILDGQPAGTFVYGVYQASECIVLTKLEILQLGLTSN